MTQDLMFHKVIKLHEHPYNSFVIVRCIMEVAGKDNSRDFYNTREYLLDNFF